MTMPFGYVSPEQVMKDRADYARKGIARGRSVVVIQYDGGILFVAENLSRALHKISEIYDRIAFAAVGKYNEFENLRMAGVRYADLRGYSYDRQDVTGRGLANVFAQTLGTIFTVESKPYEVEMVIAEVGTTAEDDQIYRLTYDGSVADEHGFVAMGGSAEQISQGLAERYRDGLTLEEALRLAVELLGRDPVSGDQRSLTAAQLEVAVLDRARPRRKFRRLTGRCSASCSATPSPASRTRPPRRPGRTSGRARRRSPWRAAPTSRRVRTPTAPPTTTRRRAADRPDDGAQAAPASRSTYGQAPVLDRARSRPAPCPGFRTATPGTRPVEVMTVPAKKDMPSTVARSSKKARDTWGKTHDSAVDQYGEGERAHRTAFAALKHTHEKVGDRWVDKGRKGPSDDQAAKSGAAARRGGPTAGGSRREGHQGAPARRRRPAGHPRPDPDDQGRAGRGDQPGE